MGRNKDLTLVLNRINELLKTKSRVVVAIDGRCASGKSTFASLLQKEIPCTVLHIDDFYLEAEYQTKERLSLPGGNIDYERFLSDVLLPLKRNETFNYTAFDCKTQSYKCPLSILPTDVTIVEGAYSCRPELAQIYDLTVFMDVEKGIQIERVLRRNGEERLKEFKERWIVFEEKYFEAFDIQSKVDIYIKEFCL